MVEDCCAANDVCASADGCDDHSGAAQQLANDNKLSGSTHRIGASRCCEVSGELGSKSAAVLPGEFQSRRSGKYQFALRHTREVSCHARHQVSTVLNDDSNLSARRLWNTSHLLLSLFQVAAVSWALLTPDPFALVRDTSLSWVQSASDLLLHASVFTVLSATVFSLCLAIFDEFPPVAVFAMLGYSVTVEGLQALVPGRTCDPRDAIANVAGFVLGLTFVRVLSLLRPAPAKA